MKHHINLSQNIINYLMAILLLNFFENSLNTDIEIYILV